MTATAQRAFSGGIISPGMYSRKDVPKFDSGLKDALNVILRAQGGIANRAGTILAGGFDNSTVDGHPWLIPFEFSSDDSYQLEFSEGVMRVLKRGEYVLTGSARGIVDMTPVSPARLEMANSGQAAEFTTGTLFFVTDTNGTSALHRTVLKSTGVDDVYVSFEIIGGRTVSGADSGWGVFGSGASAQRVFEIETPYAIEDLPRLYPAQDVDTLVLTCPGYTPQVVQRGDADDTWTIEALTLTPGIEPPENATGEAIAAGTGSSPTEYTYVVVAEDQSTEFYHTPPVSTTVDFDVTDAQVTVEWDIKPALMAFVARFDVYRTEDPGSGEYNLFSNGQDLPGVTRSFIDDNDTIQPLSSFDLDASAAVEAEGFTARLEVRQTDVAQYVVTAVGPDGAESLPSAAVEIENDLTVEGRKNRVRWDGVAGAQLYNVYKNVSGIYGFIGTTLNPSIDDDNITPDTADNPPQGRNPFEGDDRDPTIVTYVENRLTFAGLPADPQAVEMSSSITPFDFNRALTPGGSDPVSFRMRSQKLNRVEHIVPLDAPIILTAGAEWVLTTLEDGPIQPANFRLRPRSYRGSTSIRPVVVGETLIHVVRDGNTLREFSLKSNRDFPSADLTILARQLFRGKTIVSMDYAQAPDSVLWVVFSDGSCLSMTYLEEHEVWGWTRHTFGGENTKVKQVSTVREGAYDTPYFVITRDIQGASRTLVERLDNRAITQVQDAYFVDAGLTYDGTDQLELRGLLHLAGATGGEDVAVLADGSVMDSVSVDKYGKVMLQEASDKVAIGLGYEAKIVTLPVDFGDQIRDVGSAIGDYRSSSEVALQVNQTRGIAVGREGGWLNEYKQFTGDGPIPLETGTIVVAIEGDWERDASIEVSQVYPLPMEITSIVPEWSLGS